MVGMRPGNPPSAGGKVGHNFAHKRLGTRVEDVARDSTVMGARRPLCRFRSGSRLQPVKFFQSLRQGHPPGYRTTASFCRQKCVGTFLSQKRRQAISWVLARKNSQSPQQNRERHKGSWRHEGGGVVAVVTFAASVYVSRLPCRVE